MKGLGPLFRIFFPEKGHKMRAHSLFLMTTDRIYRGNLRSKAQVEKRKRKPEVRKKTHPEQLISIDTCRRVPEIFPVLNTRHSSP